MCQWVCTDKEKILWHITRKPPANRGAGFRQGEEITGMFCLNEKFAVPLQPIRTNI